MKRIYFIVSALFIAASSYSQWKEKPGKWETMRYTRTTIPPMYDSAPGIANGRLAARVLCKVKEERIFLNDNTFWPGRPRNWNSPEIFSAFKEVRRLLLAGQNDKANQEAYKMQSFNCEPYIATGNLYLDFDHGSSASNYKIVQNLDSAMIQMRYTVNGVDYTRESFVSYPDQALVIRLSCGTSGGLGLGVRLNSIDIDGNALPYKVWTEGDNTLVMQGFSGYGQLDRKADTSEMKFDARVRVLVSGGSCSASGSSLKISGADTALLVLSIATSYNGPFKHPSPDKEGLDPTPIAKDYLEKASVKPYPQLLTAHLKDFQSIYRRFWIEINGETPHRRALDFMYIRYEVIQSSRGPKGQAMTLKSIWNDKNRPEWGGHYTLNSEGPKPYWTAETGNMAEVIDPVTNFVEEMAKNGAETAKINYGCRGWVAHHNTDLWKQTAMVGSKGLSPHYCCWMFGGVFMAELLVDHYKFSGDVTYLREHAYPVLKGAAEFCLDWLVDDGKGRLTTAPSTSPENEYRFTNGQSYGVCIGSTGDMAHIRQVFLDVMEFSKLLGVDADLRKTIDSVYKRLLPFQVGGKGQLQEWARDWEEQDPHHRHISHLAALFPYGLITHRGTPELWRAAKRTMELRGSGEKLSTPDGWWARLLEPEKTLENLWSPAKPTRYTDVYGGFPELLLQSHVGELELLPALPASWTKGKVLGLRGRMGYEVDIEWENKKLTHATIRSSKGTVPIVRIQGDSVPDPKIDPRITLDIWPSGIIGGNPFSAPVRHCIDITRLSNISIPYRGAYSASVMNIRGQVVESISGVGPVTIRFVSRNWAPGLYVLKISAANGAVFLIKRIHRI